VDRRMANALLVCGLIVAALLFLVTGFNDKGGTVEVGLLEGTPVVATDSECDAMYHAIWKVKQEPSHSTLISIAESLDCPFSE
jgi:hypothetical protein